MEKMSKEEKRLFITSITFMLTVAVVGFLVSYTQDNIKTALGFGMFSVIIMVSIILIFLLKLRDERKDDNE